MNKEKITKKTKIWYPNLDIVMPIDSSEISAFENWINWNGYRNSNEDRHRGFDFAAYIKNGNECILGLPSKTIVRAIADGFVKQVSRGLGGPYATFINIEHGKEGRGLFSSYHHITPLVGYGEYVKKGESIATLHKDPGYYKGRLVHLHFELTNSWDNEERDVNPADIFNGLDKLIAEPQGRKKFKLIGLKSKPKICTVNFKILMLN